MLTLEEIESAFQGTKPMSGQISMASLSTLSKFTAISLGIDENSFDYYYSLDVDKLAKSIADKDCLQDLVNDGWSLSKDKTQIIKYVQNFT